jgi:hypothetical protein
MGIAALLEKFWPENLNTAPGVGCVQYTADVMTDPGRAVEIFCTTTGIIQLVLIDGSVLPFYMPAIGPYSRNYAIKGYNSSGTTATVTMWKII